MNHKEEAAKHPNDNKDKATKQIRLPAWLWVVIGAISFIAAGILYLIIVGVGLFTVSRYLGKGTDPVNFIIVNLLSALIFAAVVIQAAIYFVQWRAMRDALKQGRDALGVSERAYVGVRSIVLSPTRSRDITKRDMQNINMAIENVGKLPADKIFVYVDVIMLVPESVRAKYPNSLSGYYHYDWWWNFKSTKLFRGNINFEILIPLDEKLNPIQWSRISAGDARIITQIRIDYDDGFGQRQRSDYAFRLEAGKWIPWWAWTGDAKDQRIAEEVSRYPQYKADNPN